MPKNAQLTCSMSVVDALLFHNRLNREPVFVLSLLFTALVKRIPSIDGG